VCKSSHEILFRFVLACAKRKEPYISITRLNPETMHKSPAFSQVAVVDASAKRCSSAVRTAWMPR